SRNTKIDIFHFHVFIQSVTRSFPAYPGLLDSPKWSACIGNPPLIYAHHPCFNGLHYPPTTMHIIAVEISSKPEFRIISHLDSFFFRCKSEQGRYWSECLFLCNQRIYGYILEDCRFIKQSFDYFASRQYTSTLLNSVI